jgi:hypothetical protein
MHKAIYVHAVWLPGKRLIYKAFIMDVTVEVIESMYHVTSVLNIKNPKLKIQTNSVICPISKWTEQF